MIIFSIKRLREVLPDFIQAQLTSYLQGSESLILATDDSPALDGGSNYSSLGLINETGKYMNLGYIQNDNKTAKGISTAMCSVLEGSRMFNEIYSKLSYDIQIISDSAPAQRLANMMLLEKMSAKFGDNESLKIIYLLNISH